MPFLNCFVQLYVSPPRVSSLTAFSIVRAAEKDILLTSCFPTPSTVWSVNTFVRSCIELRRLIRLHSSTRHWTLALVVSSVVVSFIRTSSSQSKSLQHQLALCPEGLSQLSRHRRCRAILTDALQGKPIACGTQLNRTSRLFSNCFDTMSASLLNQ